MRPHTLTAAVMPVLVGTSMSWSDGSLDVALFAAMLIASVLIQSAVNMFNEYFDYKRGLDSEESVGIGGVIVRNEIRDRAVFSAAVAFFAASMILGVYICLRTTWWIAAAGSLSMAVGFLYSGGRSPLAYSALGEIAAGIFMGPVIVLISYFIQTNTLTIPALLLSIPISILVAAILLANNIRDSEQDRKKGRRTLAILLKKKKAVALLASMLAASYVWTVLLVSFGIVTPWILLVVLAAPKAYGAVRAFGRGSSASEMMPAMKMTSVLHTQFGLLMSIGIVVGRLIAAL